MDSAPACTPSLVAPGDDTQQFRHVEFSEQTNIASGTKTTSDSFRKIDKVLRRWGHPEPSAPPSQWRGYPRRNGVFTVPHRYAQMHHGGPKLTAVSVNRQRVDPAPLLS